ncbi:quinolinate phosphoribosyl transferase, C-terminal domain protein [delta proteobacterium NaphS2]|nr:quinolinate phosphoribosyl transferase, C-terminal domain protein [delta proteobacterium NaphS2]
MIHTANSQQIRDGLVTDVYFERTQEILRAKGIDRSVTAEFLAKDFPRDYPWAVLAGIEECVALLKDLPVDVRIIQEGTLIQPFQPVLEIRGKYLDFGRYETALLGFLCQASGVATMAARCRKAAGNRTLTSFGARRMHPAIAPMVERNAYIGGCDGVAMGLGAQLAGIEPSGTMPHALILIMGDTVAATEAFHDVIDPRVKRVSLIDTFNDEKMEALNVAEALGKDLYAVRLDTPKSRRGNFRKILEEVRWELDLRGHKHVKLFISGGLDEYRVQELRDCVDAFGVGTAITAAPVIDFSMDIVEVENKPLAKKGKRSGSKSVMRCEACMATEVVPKGKKTEACSCGGTMVEILKPFLSKGKMRTALFAPSEIRNHVIGQLDKIQEL